VMQPAAVSTSDVVPVGGRLAPPVQVAAEKPQPPLPRPQLPEPKQVKDPKAPLSDDPCVCSFSGIVMGVETGHVGCTVHGKEPKAALEKYCMVQGGNKCLKAQPSEKFAGQWWRKCVTPVDNIAMVLPKSCKILVPPPSRAAELRHLQQHMEKWDVVYHHPKDVTVESSEGIEEARSLVHQMKDWSTTKSPQWLHQHHLDGAQQDSTDSAMLPKALQEVKPSQDTLAAHLHHHDHSSGGGLPSDFSIDAASLVPKAPSAPSGGSWSDFLWGSDAASTTTLPRTNFLRKKEEGKSLMGGMFGWFSGKTAKTV